MPKHTKKLSILPATTGTTITPRDGGTVILDLRVTLDPAELPLDGLVVETIQQAPKGGKMALAAELMRLGMLVRQKVGPEQAARLARLGRQSAVRV